jgi:hypothetical protein
MAKKGGGEGWGILIVLGVIGGLVLLDYTQSGRGGENNAPLVPDRLEGKIDWAVDALNKKYGNLWVNQGLDVVMSYLQKALPQPLVAAVFAVEELSKFLPMTGPAKRQEALNRLSAV